MSLNYRPGINVNTVDGGLSNNAPPTAHSVLIIGSSNQGVANQPYQVTDRAKAALEFGLSGNLIRSMEEAVSNSNNVMLFRMGTKPLTVSGVGQQMISQTISNVGRTVGGLVTITTTAPHTYLQGALVTTVAVTNVTVNVGPAVLTAVTSTTYSYQTAVMTLIAAAPDTGTSLIASPASPGFSLTFGKVSATSAVDYSIWYKTGSLAVYYLGSIVYSNDAAAPVNTGDVTITGLVSSSLGLTIGTGATYGAVGATNIKVSALGALVPTATTPLPVVTAAVTGVGLTGRQNFVAFMNALNLLDGFQTEELVVPSATFDAANVAYYVAANTATAINNPAVNADALDWLLTTSDSFGNKVFRWASETTDSTGATVAVYTPVSAMQRLSDGYNEVSWGYAMANFCASVSTLNQTCIGFIGTSAPPTYKLVDVRKWVGFLPKLDASGNVNAAGYGLLGIPYVNGTNAAALNAFAFDYSTGYRQPGFFQTAQGQYDGTVQTDSNQFPIDIGAYLHVVADQAILSNGYAKNYVANLAAYTAGYCSVLDEKNALTNKSLPVKQIPGLIYTPGQQDALTQSKINVLKFKGANTRPALLHDFTVATNLSDYSQVLRVRIKGLVVATMLAIGDPFVGASSLDGLQLNSLKTALDNGLVALQKRGYCSNPQVTISTTDALASIGHANLYVTFHPADQTIQLNAFVGLSK